jgi:PHD/YefM family antitoxin component YafN of YafNO toxin-antitoxin module
MKEADMKDIENELECFFTKCLTEPVLIKRREVPLAIVLPYSEYERIQGREKRNVHYSGWRAAFDSYISH